MSASRTGSRKPPSTIPSASAGRVQNSAWPVGALLLGVEDGGFLLVGPRAVDGLDGPPRGAPQVLDGVLLRLGDEVGLDGRPGRVGRAGDGSRCMAPVMTRALSGLMPGRSMACRVAGACWSSWASFTSRAASRWETPAVCAIHDWVDAAP